MAARIIAALILLLALGIFSACDDDDDDNDDTSPADDDSAGDDDDSMPCRVGWFSIADGANQYAWSSLKRITDASVEDVTPVGPSPFFTGSLPTPEVGWAANHMTLFELLDGQWQEAADQPPCVDDGYDRAFALARFANGSGHAVCRNPGRFYSYDGQQWSAAVEIENAKEMSCRGYGDCLVWGGYDIHRYKNGEVTTLSGAPGAPEAAELLQNGVPIALFKVPEDDDYFWALRRRRNGAWEPDPNFDENQRFWWPYRMVRYDSERLALCARSSDKDGCWLLSVDGPAEPMDWPFFRRLAFAASGSGSGYGVAEENGINSLYEIADGVATPIFEIPEDEDPSGFLSAADAE